MDSDAEIAGAWRAPRTGSAGKRKFPSQKPRRRRSARPVSRQEGSSSGLGGALALTWVGSTSLGGAGVEAEVGGHWILGLPRAVGARRKWIGFLGFAGPLVGGFSFL